MGIFFGYKISERGVDKNSNESTWGQVIANAGGEWPSTFEASFATVQTCGNSFLPAYAPSANRRRNMEYGEREKQWQLYRRGRYVEFNLVYDRGTIFGLQTNGRTESILMSLPPLVRWDYDYKPEPNTPESELHETFLKPQDWVNWKF